MPASDLRLSVFRINGLDQQGIHNLGTAKIQDKEPHGWARFTEDAIAETNRVAKADLSLDKNDDPPRHADIVGWPAEKTDQMALAAELANASTLVLTREAA